NIVTVSAEQHALWVIQCSATDDIRGLAGRSLDVATRESVASFGRLTDSLARGLGDAGDELASLETAVESADREPTKQARDVCSGLREEVTGAVRRWQRVVADELPALNRRLARQGAPAVQVSEPAADRRAGPWSAHPPSAI